MMDGTKLETLQRRIVDRSAGFPRLYLCGIRAAVASLPPPAPQSPIFVMHADDSRALIDGLVDACRRARVMVNVYREDALRPGCAWCDPNPSPPSVYFCEDDIQLLTTVAAFDAWMSREDRL